MLVIGGGGHALVSIEVLRACGHDVAGCLTRDGSAAADLDRVGVAVLGTDGDLARLVADGYPRAFVAVGDNADRQRLSEGRASTAGGSLVRAVSPAAVVSATARRRRRCARDARCGRQCRCRPRTRGHRQHARVRRPRLPDRRRSPTSPRGSPSPATSPSVRARSSAVGASVAPGRRIGAWAIVGAGAAVVRDVAPGETVVGVPARPLRPGHR